MARITFITGGARSGKSVFAEKLALDYGTPLGYLATAQTLDNEMTERVGKHRQRRGDDWQTMEEPLRVADTLRGHDGYFNAILVDCVTLWLSNLLFHHGEDHDAVEERIMEDVHRLTITLGEMVTPVILVSNETGMGIVPENRLARVFRDIAGRTNQILAAAADEAHVVISGIPIRLK